MVRVVSKFLMKAANRPRLCDGASVVSAGHREKANRTLLRSRVTFDAVGNAAVRADLNLNVRTHPGASSENCQVMAIPSRFQFPCV